MMASADNKTMWIQMKTFEFSKKEDINEILALNKVKLSNNSFEIVFKDVKKYSHRIVDSLNIVIIETAITLGGENSKFCHVIFVNVKNEKREHFSSLIENFSENDRIIVINGIICQNSDDLSANQLTIGVRQENNSSVLLFKFKISYSALSDNLPISKNLSQISLPGFYSLFGRVLKMGKYSNKEHIILRLLCCEPSSIKTLKYFLSTNKYKNIENKFLDEEKYHLYSNKVDVLVIKPCMEFFSLALDQQVCLNNVKVESDEFNIFSFKVKGINTNLNANPTETGSVNCLSPFKKPFPVSNNLKPEVKKQQISTSSTKMSSIVNKCKNQSTDISDSSFLGNVHSPLTKKVQTTLQNEPNAECDVFDKSNKTVTVTNNSSNKMNTIHQFKRPFPVLNNIKREVRKQPIKTSATEKLSLIVNKCKIQCIDVSFSSYLDNVDLPFYKEAQTIFQDEPNAEHNVFDESYKTVTATSNSCSKEMNAIHQFKKPFPVLNNIKPEVKNQQIKASATKKLSFVNKCKNESIGKSDLSFLGNVCLPLRNETQTLQNEPNAEHDVFDECNKTITVPSNSTKELNSSPQFKRPFPIFTNIKPAFKKRIKMSQNENLPSIVNKCKNQFLEASDLSTLVADHLPSTKESQTSQNTPNSKRDVFVESNTVKATSKFSTEGMDSKPQITNHEINRQMFTENDCFHEKPLDESYSHLLFQNFSKAMEIVPFNQSVTSLQLNSGLLYATQCLGPCRLVLTDPNVYCTDEIVHGHCAQNCNRFFPITALKKKSSINEYVCPSCTNIVCLTFYFKLNFLYGSDESRALEVCCYGVNALHILKKLTKKNIEVDNYLSNYEDRNLVINTIQMLINKKTKMNIIVGDSPNNQTKQLLAVDIKYVVTLAC